MKKYATWETTLAQDIARALRSGASLATSWLPIQSERCTPAHIFLLLQLGLAKQATFSLLADYSNIPGYSTHNSNTHPQ
jgi:hypothetical protein